MIRILLLGSAACLAATVIHVASAEAQNRTTGHSYQSRTYQQNSSYNRMSSSASRAFAPVRSNTYTSTKRK